MPNDSDRDGIKLNGQSREFLERFSRLEEKSKNTSEDVGEIKTDIKEIKEILVPMANKIYYHEKVIKAMGTIGGILITGIFIVLTAVL